MSACPRHPNGTGPAWCQDCHGFHLLERPDPVDLGGAPDEPVRVNRPRRPTRTELAVMRARRRELLALLRRAREEKDDWYVWVLERAAARRRSP